MTETATPSLSDFKLRFAQILASRDALAIRGLCAEHPKLSKQSLRSPWLNTLLARAEDYALLHLWHPNNSHLRSAEPDALRIFRESVDALAFAGFSPGPKIRHLWLKSFLAEPSDGDTLHWMLARAYLAPAAAAESAKDSYFANGILNTLKAMDPPEAKALALRLASAGFAAGPDALCGPTDLYATGQNELARCLIAAGHPLGLAGYGLRRPHGTEAGTEPLSAIAQHYEFQRADMHGPHVGVDQTDPEAASSLSLIISELASHGARADSCGSSAQSLAPLLQYKTDMSVLEGPGRELLALGADPNDGDDFAIAIASHLRAWMGNRSRAYGIDPMQILDWAVAQGFSPELHAGAMLSEIVGFIELSESLECVKILADYGAAPSKVSPTGPSPLSLCIDWCKYDLAWALADQGLPLDYVDQRGETAFHLLAKHATKPHVLARAKLAERPATPALLRLESRHPERMGQTPLHIACATLNSEAIRLYLASGADPNALDAQGWSPLRHLLRKNGAQKAAKSEAALRMLLNAGADASLPDSSGLTPAQATSARAHLGALGILLEARPEDVSAQTPASAKARSKLEARGHQGQSLSEKAQMTSIASSSESCAPPARSSKSL